MRTPLSILRVAPPQRTAELTRMGRWMIAVWAAINGVLFLLELVVR
jgi:hypothetical protein